MNLTWIKTIDGLPESSSSMPIIAKIRYPSEYSLYRVITWDGKCNRFIEFVGCEFITYNHDFNARNEPTIIAWANFNKFN